MRGLPQGEVPQGVLLIGGEDMKRHISNEVLCPFYHSEDAYRICCEGLEEGSTVHVVFSSSTKKQSFSRRYCCKDYKACKIANILYEKYGGDAG